MTQTRRRSLRFRSVAIEKIEDRILLSGTAALLQTDVQAAAASASYQRMIVPVSSSNPVPGQEHTFLEKVVNIGEIPFTGGGPPTAP